MGSHFLVPPEMCGWARVRTPAGPLKDLQLMSNPGLRSGWNLCFFSVCQNVADNLRNQRCLCLCSLLFAQIHFCLCSTLIYIQNLFGWGKKSSHTTDTFQTEQGGYTNAACLYLVGWYNSQQLFTVWEKNNMSLTDCCLFIFPFLPGQW